MAWTGTELLNLWLLMLLLWSCSLSQAAKPQKGRANKVYRGHKKESSRNSWGLCEPKYQKLSPSHTRCLEDNPKAILVKMTESQQNSIVQLHNDYRKHVDPAASDMMAVQWDDSLAISASKWVMQCIGDHDRMKDRQEPDWINVKIGQNLGTGHSSWASMLSRMYGEKERLGYVYGEEYIEGAGHFYQLVTGRTTRIGCAEARCPHTDYKILRVCNYAPSLDSSRPPYKNGTSCGDCPKHCDSSGQLCDCKGMLCYNGGTLDPRTCKCICQEGKTGDHCEKVDCSKPDPFQSCQSGFYSRQDCGRKGIVIEDAKMCPHLCGLCGKPCGGLICKNGGRLDWSTCQCHCPGLLSGPTCETCPVKDEDYCTLFLPKSECSGNGVIKLGDCPIYCGVCNTSCSPCQNQGDLNTRDCTCQCKGQFTGAHCEICPTTDPEHCTTWNKTMCNETPYSFAIARTECPHLCGSCPRKQAKGHVKSRE